MKQLTLTIALLTILVFGLINLFSLPVLADSASCSSEQCRCSCTGIKCSCSAADGSCYCSCFDPILNERTKSECNKGEIGNKSKDRNAL